MDVSFVKLMRKLKDWEWYKNSEMVHLFIHLLLSANFVKGKFQGIDVDRGQLITGRNTLSENTGISSQTVRTCLNRLKLTNEITIKSTNKFSLITVVKYEMYQGFEKKQPTKQPTKQQTDNHQLTTIEEVNNKENNTYRKFAHLEITKEQNLKIVELGYSQEQINSIYDAIENYSKNKNYSSLYLTSLKWLKKQFPFITEKVNEELCPYSELQMRLAVTSLRQFGEVPEWFDKKWKHLVKID